METITMIIETWLKSIEENTQMIKEMRQELKDKYPNMFDNEVKPCS